MPRILGIDFGTRRVGASLSDARGQIAFPLEVYERRDVRLDSQHYRGLVEDEGVDRIVIGLPLHTGGGEGELARQARNWGRWLAETTGRAVLFYDERYTSVDADHLMRAQGLKLRDRKARRDMMAALIMLQNYLDAGCPEAEAPAEPLEDAPESEPGP